MTTAAPFDRTAPSDSTAPSGTTAPSATTAPSDSTAAPAATAVRIGTAERARATEALDAHLEAGRLDAEEYGGRVARVSVARTHGELAPLFADLPAPGPSAPPRRTDTAAPRSQPRWSSAPPLPADPAAVPDHRHGLGWLLGATPVLATTAFFVLLACGVSMAWLAFLAIPLVSCVLCGDPKGHKRYRRHYRGC